MKVLRFDGASRGNPGRGSCAAILFDKDKMEGQVYKILPGMVTNNEAEYMGLIAGLKYLQSLNIDEVQVEGDSKLVIEQLFGSWQCKHPRLKPYYQTAKELFKSFKFINGRWIPRQQNAVADAYCNRALDAKTFESNLDWFLLPIRKKDKTDLRNYFTASSSSDLQSGQAL